MTLRDDAILVCGFIYGTVKDIPGPVVAAMDRLQLASLHEGDEITHEIKYPVVVKMDERPAPIKVHLEPHVTSPAEFTPPPLPPVETKEVKKALTKENKEEIIRLYNEGKSAGQIQQEFKERDILFTCGTVYYTLKGAGVQTRPSGAEMKKAAKLEREKAENPEPVKPVEKPFVPVPADKLSRDHKDYAGQREDKTLNVTDLPDILKMRSNGLPDIRIARSYGVEPEYLTRFLILHKDTPVDNGNSAGNF